MKTRRVFHILLVVFAFTVLVFLLIHIMHKPKKVEVLSGTIKIDTIEQIPQGDEYYIAKPKKMLCYKDKIFILDVKFYRILVFGKDGYSHYIGHPGQGPGEISQPISMAIENDRVYVLNSPDRIEAFDLFGKYLKTIRLKIARTPIKSLGDFKIFDGKIYVSLEIGEVSVQRYDLNGRWIDNFISGGNKIDLGKTILANPNDIYLIPELGTLILFNRFTGDIETFSLKTGNLLDKVNNYDQVVAERIASFKKNENGQSAPKRKIEVKVFIMFHANLDIKKLQLHILPSQSSVSREDMRDIIYTLNLNNLSMERKRLHFDGIEKKYIRYCCVVEDSIFFIDDELNLFKGGLK